MKKWPKKSHFLQKIFIKKWQNLYKKIFHVFLKTLILCGLNRIRGYLFDNSRLSFLQPVPFFATVIFLITHGYVFNDRQIYFFEHGYLNHNHQKILIILAKPYFLRVCYPLKFSLNFLVFQYGYLFDNSRLSF